MKKTLFLFILMLTIYSAQAKPTGSIINIENRKSLTLNGEWKIIIDPYEVGYYTYRWEVKKKSGYFENKKIKTPRDLVEYDFDKSSSLYVPGDWNTQREDLFFYEGTVWYKKSFDYDLKQGKRLFVYFGGANYHSVVYLNGKKLGEHTGGFTPFSFEITNLVNKKDNFLIVKVDNKRYRDGVPTLNTDWWNYGGITRQVLLVETPETFINDYSVALKKGSENEISGWLKLDGKNMEQEITVSIPEVNSSQKIKSDSSGYANFTFEVDVELWSPNKPTLYDVKLSTQTDQIVDKIGFRTISTKGDKILLNGKSLFLRGISIHEEAPDREGRAYSEQDARIILSQAKELGCNFVRLAHYPHNEFMLREADRIGMMVWSEIPVYWTILWDNQDTYKNAENQLNEMITRDKNRASVIIWSVANETPRGDARMSFLTNLIAKARELDKSRLISAATEVKLVDGYRVINDPLVKYLDIIGVNFYYGWYGGKPEDTPKVKWKSPYKKPLVMSEFGAGAKFGLHGKKEERWTEEYQEYLYKQQFKMLSKMPFLRGMSPWILKDFRSPRRPLPIIQDFYNRKGLLSEKGEKKKAWFALQKFYKRMKK